LGLHINTSIKYRYYNNIIKIIIRFVCIKVLGGYLSDKIGGQRVILLSAIGWSFITFWMPNIISIAPNMWSWSIPFIVTVRIINGACQGVHFPSMISITSQVNI